MDGKQLKLKRVVLERENFPIYHKTLIMKTISQAFRFFGLLLLCTLFSLSLSAQSISGSGNVVEKDRNISGFTAIQVSSGVDVHIKQGNSDKVIVKTDDNLQDRIKTELSGGTLKITAKGSIRKAKAFDVYITAKDLTEISASSGSDVEGDGTLAFDKLRLNMSSGSDVELSIDAKELHCELSSGSDADLDGKVGKLVVKASGGSDLKAKGLQVQDCKLRVSGGSDAFVNVNGDLDMEASGASDIHYSGSPSVVHSKASGASDIHGN